MRIVIEGPTRQPPPDPWRRHGRLLAVGGGALLLGLLCASFVHALLPAAAPSSPAWTAVGTALVLGLFNFLGQVLHRAPDVNRYLPPLPRAPAARRDRVRAQATTLACAPAALGLLLNVVPLFGVLGHIGPVGLGIALWALQLIAPVLGSTIGYAIEVPEFFPPTSASARTAASTTAPAQRRKARQTIARGGTIAVRTVEEICGWCKQPLASRPTRQCPGCGKSSHRKCVQGFSKCPGCGFRIAG